MKEITLKEIENELKTTWDDTARVKYWKNYGKERIYFTCYTRSGHESSQGSWDLANGVIADRTLKSNNWKETNALLEKYKGYTVVVK